MSNIYQDPKDLAKSHLVNLIRLAQVDEEVHHHEIMFIHSLAMKFGLSDIEFKLVVELPDRIASKVPYDDVLKMQYYFQSLTLMNIDFVAHPNEQEFCLELGKKLRIPSYHCSKLVQYMVEHIGKIVSFQEFEQSIND